MAKCDLSIELDDPDRVYAGGETITGTLHVMADADVTCKALEITSGWKTHGRGNVASGTAETVTLFTGQWTAGQKESYRFELTVADWPPSYHGHFINVDHSIDARAKIPWAFDPKASQPFTMLPVSAPESDKVSQATELSGCIGTGVAVLILAMLVVGCCIFATVLIANPFFGLVFGVIFFPVVGWIAAKRLLPKWLLGKVEADLITTQVAPGERVRARMAFQPKRRVTLNSITAELTGAEVCVSGSGSNRRTHRHTFFSDRHELEGSTTLQAGDRREFNLDFPIPDDVPHSFDLADNNLNWTIEMRVDIPRWPDWTKSLKLLVLPDGDARPSNAPPRSPALQFSGEAEIGDATDSAGGEELTFAETASHVWNCRDDEDQIEMLIEAVRGITFDIDTYIERRLLYSGDDDPHLYQDGYAVWARHDDPPLPLVLYIPHELGDEFEQAGNDLWRCRGTIVGWDRQHRRLQIKVLVS